MAWLQSRGDLALVLVLEQLRVDPVDVDLYAIGDAAVHERFVERLVRVRQADIFADHADSDFAFRVLQTIHDIEPALEIRLAARLDAERAQHFVVQPLGMILRGHGVDAVRVQRGNDGFLGDIAEEPDLRALTIRQRLLAATHQHIRRHAQRCELPHTVLGGLSLQLARRRDIGHQRHMDADGLATPQLIAELADRLNERQRFDVANSSADLAQNEIEIVRLSERESLDRIRHMRNDLHGRTEIVPAPLALDDLLIDAPGRDVVRLTGRNAGKALIMAEIEIGLCPVVRHIDLAMLVRRHRAGIDVQIGIELADADSVAACLKQRSERGGHEAFAKR